MGDFKLLLISVIFERNAIWDQRHADHHNRFKLEKLWNEVAKECGTTTNEVKKKWKTLRQQFREKNQALPKLSSGASTPDDTVDWPYFKPLLFLRDNFEHKPKSGNLSCMEVVEAEDIADNNDYEEDHWPKTPASDTSQSLSEPQLAISSLGNRKRPIDPVGSELVELEREKLRMRKEKYSQSANREDEDLAFFTSLLPHVRRMTPVNKMSFRIEVQKLVMDKAYGSNYVSCDISRTNSPVDERACDDPLRTPSVCDSQGFPAISP